MRASNRYQLFLAVIAFYFLIIPSIPAAAAVEGAMLLDYDLRNGKSLKLGSVEFSDVNFRFSILPAGQLEQLLTETMSKSQAAEWVLVGVWPEVLMQGDKLEIVDSNGQILWVKDWGRKGLAKWKERLDSWQKDLIKSGIEASEAKKMQILDSQFGLVGLNSENSPFWKISAPIRFCVSQQIGQTQSRMCSRYYDVARDAQKISLYPSSEVVVPARVMVANKSAPLFAKNEVAVGSLVQFFAETTSGASFEFLGKPRRLSLVEIAKTKSGLSLVVTGRGVKPQEKVVAVNKVNKVNNSKWDELLGPQGAISDEREFWQVQVPLDAAFLTVPGEGAGIFVQTLMVQVRDIPPEELRPRLEQDAAKGTYKSSVKLKGQIIPGVRLSTKMKSVEQQEDGRFIWIFQTDKMGEKNRSYLNVSSGDKNFKVYSEVYRGFPGEFGLRLTGGKGFSMAEGSLNYWFENLWGWEDPVYSTLRWGASIKYFTSLSDVTSKTTTAPFKELTAALKYRLTPGLANREASGGLILGFNSLDYDVHKTKMLGAGVFWGRSMPLVFDEIFNLMPFFRYPKWVDIEFLYYPLMMEAGFKAGYRGNYALNFHGKVMWTKSLFGEAGFGVKNVDIIKGATATADAQNLTLTTIFATLGFGVLF